MASFGALDLIASFKSKQANQKASLSSAVTADELRSALQRTFGENGRRCALGCLRRGDLTDGRAPQAFPLSGDIKRQPFDLRSQVGALRQALIAVLAS
jgi:hypothetical protein